jgi:hypothetical protein
VDPNNLSPSHGFIQTKLMELIFEYKNWISLMNFLKTVGFIPWTMKFHPALRDKDLWNNSRATKDCRQLSEST